MSKEKKRNNSLHAAVRRHFAILRAKSGLGLVFLKVAKLLGIYGPSPFPVKKISFRECCVFH